MTTAPDGSNQIRAAQGPTGSRERSTETVSVTLSPGRSLPWLRLSRSHGSEVAALQRTGAAPSAVRVTTVT